MAGMREFRAGEIWFYYNEDATKTLERKKELGAITSRPVLIIQDAFYPEWCESVTVLPMTSSDRRSGIHVDSTVFSDGAMIEGGTILPYLFYTVKTKYLFPISAEGKSNKPKLVTMAPELFEEVKQAVAYHLGFSSEEPRYVKEWKHLDDFGRNVVIRDIRLTTAIWGYNQASSIRVDQEKCQVDCVENHIVATCSSRQSLKSDAEKSDIFSIDFPTDELLKIRKQIDPGKTANLTFRKYARDDDEFTEFLYDVISFDASESRVHPGSEFLTEVPFAKAPQYMTDREKLQIVDMSGREVMENTGITSLSSAYRLIRYIKEERDTLEEQYINSCITLDDAAIMQFNDLPRACNRSKSKRYAKRVKRFLEIPKELAATFVTESNEDLKNEFPDLSLSEIYFIRTTAIQMYPNMDVGGMPLRNYRTTANVDLVELDANMASAKYEMWDTLSVHELNEVASASKRNCSTLARKYGLQRAKFLALKEQAISTLKKGGIPQTSIDMSRAELICKQVAQSKDYHEFDNIDLLIFCRTPHQQIMDVYSSTHTANTPSKEEIAKIKRIIRSIITKKF